MMKVPGKWTICGILLLWYFIIVLLLLHRIGKKKEKDSHVADMRAIIQGMSGSFDQQLQELESIDQQLQSIASKLEQILVLPVLVLTCNRPAYLERTLTTIIKYSTAQYLPAGVTTKLIVSQDCNKADVSDVIAKYQQNISIWLKQPNQTAIPIQEKNKKMEGYYWLSRHFKFALNSLFEQNHNFVIIIEDDLDISPDFFQYFVAGLMVMIKDPSIWCISAWNDNGKTDLIENNPELLHRTEFFPGLGWLLTKSVWMEIKSGWPPAYWDDWMRKPEQRKGRSCIRPEISRSSTFGKLGTSQGQFFDKFLRFIQHYGDFVPFTDLDLSYLLEKNYADNLKRKAFSAQLLPMEVLDSIGNDPSNSAYRLEYSSQEQFKNIAKKLGMMDDFKAGVPRTGYMGIVSVMKAGKRIYVTPPENWKGYDTSWT